MASESEQQPPTTLVNKEDPITYQLALLKLKKQQAIQQPDTKKNKRVSRFKLILSEAGFSDKKLWDWLNLFSALAIPIIIFGATIWFSLLQFQLANQQNAQDQKLAEQQHVADQQHALDQQHAAIFQTYIDNIQDLLLNHHLRDATSNSEIAILARARTLTALQGLDSERRC